MEFIQAFSAAENQFCIWAKILFSFIKSEWIDAPVRKMKACLWYSICVISNKITKTEQNFSQKNYFTKQNYEHEGNHVRLRYYSTGLFTYQVSTDSSELFHL